MFVLYKICNKNNSVIISEVFEKEEDAKNKMKILTQDRTPEENAEETFSIQETWYTTTKQYNFPESPFKYTEEDNSVDETDLESTKNSSRNQESIDDKPIIDYNNIVDEVVKRIVIKSIKLENDNSDVYLYIYLCFVIIVFLIIIVFLAVCYMP